MKRAALFLAALTGLVCFLLGLVAAGSHSRDGSTPYPLRPEPTQKASLTVMAEPAAPAPALPSGQADFAAVANNLNGAVVNVDAAARGSEDRSRLVIPRRWQDEGGAREGSGSGFIIDPAGLILTNFHVIDGADRLTVKLRDGRMYRAQVVGVDPAIDVALLQIPARDPLMVAPLGKSESLRVGEWVCAIGNPLGYDHSVTVGVVSFLGRKVFDPSLDSLIQTDAAITFGNSGGPLINARGQVVGITTAISAQAANIGFAVPIDQVIAVLPQLRERGRVSRGYIGIGLTNLTSVLQRALKIEPAHGALVEYVSADTPAERAGLRTYDVIVAADGHAIQSDDELIRYISAREPGAMASLDVWRDGEVRPLQVKLEERPLLPALQPRGPVNANVEPASRDGAMLGFSVRDREVADARRLAVPDTLSGVVIVDVDPAGPARIAPIHRGQVLLEVNRQRVTSEAEFRAVLASLRPGAAVAVLVYDPSLKERAIYSITIDPPQS
ncbi:MAG TPA: trypsin-like peptidase domain-containing protein [Vicinamibacterales bacterium]|nr:trypsin-like peptidase domain-containing protein [Vicinamibacterales bacterium]